MIRSRIARGLMASLAAIAMVLAAPVQAGEVKPGVVKKVAAKKVKPAKRLTAEEESDEARANSRDPSGDYKGYPNWARAAIGPRFDQVK